MSITTEFSNGRSRKVLSRPTIQEFFALCDELDDEDCTAVSGIRRARHPQGRELFKRVPGLRVENWVRSRG